MRTRPLPSLLLALAATLAAAAPAAASPAPGERARQAHARRVLAEIQGLDARLEQVVQSWDGARLRLDALDRQVRANRASLRLARRTLRVARTRLARRLVVIYESGEPSTLDVLVGSASLSQLIDRIQAAADVARQDRQIAAQTATAAGRYARRERALHVARSRQRATVGRLAATRSQVEAGLARRRRLLASIHRQIARIRAAERAREQRLATAARARIARELAAAQARARAAARAAAARGTDAPDPQPVPRPQAAPAPAPQPAPAAPSTPAPPAPAAAGGHPEAAAIAARYLGVPYRWGGSSPAGFDCSGLVSYVYAQLGISLPHYTVAQWNATLPISRGELQPGDLVFFDGLGHVGIYIGGGQFIHAPHTGDVVRVSSLGESWYAGHFDGARRVP